MEEIFSNGHFSVFLEKIGPLETNVGFVIDESKQQLALVDAPPGTWDFIQSHFPSPPWTISHLLITHGHWDHIMDACRFAEQQIPLWAGKADALCLQHPEIMTAFGLDIGNTSPCNIDHYPEDGHSYELFPSFSFQTFHVPGHSPGSFAYYFPSASLAFVGDTLFAGGVGRSDLPGGQKALLFQSIRQRLYTLPETTRIVPGHGPLTSIAQEKQSNPYVGPLSAN